MLDKITQLRERLALLERGGGGVSRRESGSAGASASGSGTDSNRASGSDSCRGCSLPSGHAALDAHLPAGGWPLGAVTELLSDSTGAGELQLLLPALSQLAHAGRCVVWVAPPYLPYAPALAQRGLPLDRLLLVHTTRPQESLWAIEQALRCPSMGAVLGWTAHIVDRSLRRLQLAAEAGGTLGILHRPVAAAEESSPAALRLRLHASADDLVLEIRKARGGRAGGRIALSRASMPCRAPPPRHDSDERRDGVERRVALEGSHAVVMHSLAGAAT